MAPQPWVSPRPFVVGPDDARAVFVLVHGFTGSPAEVHLLAERLGELGHRVIGPLLPGHGTSEEQLRVTHRSEWIETVRDAVMWAEESADRVILGGLSMGGLLSTIVAARYPQHVDGVALLAPAFEVDNPLFPLAGIGRFLLRSLPARALPQAGLTSPDGWKRLWHYDRRPLDAIWQLRRVQQEAWDRLPDVRQPTVLLQGLEDKTLVADGAQPAFDLLGARRKNLIWLERSGHCLTVDVELDTVVAALDELALSLLG